MLEQQSRTRASERPMVESTCVRGEYTVSRYFAVHMTLFVRVAKYNLFQISGHFVNRGLTYPPN